MSFLKTADDLVWPRGVGAALGGHSGNGGHNSQDVDGSQKGESLCGKAGLQPGETRYHKETHRSVNKGD